MYNRNMHGDSAMFNSRSTTVHAASSSRRLLSTVQLLPKRAPPEYCQLWSHYASQQNNLKPFINQDNVTHTTNTVHSHIHQIVAPKKHKRDWANQNVEYHTIYSKPIFSKKWKIGVPGFTVFKGRSRFLKGVHASFTLVSCCFTLVRAWIPTSQSEHFCSTI